MSDPVPFPTKVDVIDENEMASDIYQHLKDLFRKEPAVACCYMVQLFQAYHRDNDLQLFIEPTEDEPE